MRIEKTFVLSDDSINSYGFRTLTAGLDLDDFKRNPIGYYNHKPETGVVVRWEDLSTANNRLTGKPNINMNNPLGQRIYDDIMNGFLNSASVWLVPKEVSTKPEDLLSGQDGATVIKWRCLECSLCDTPANANAVIVSDENGNKLSLSAFNPKALPAWELTELQGLLKLSGLDLWKNDKLERLKQLSYSDFQAKYIQAFGKPYQDASNEALSAVIISQYQGAANEMELQELKKLSGHDLYMKGGLERLKVLDMETFKLKYKEAFKLEYKGN